MQYLPILLYIIVALSNNSTTLILANIEDELLDKNINSLEAITLLHKLLQSSILLYSSISSK